MNPDAEIIGWKYPWGVMLTWKGGHYAAVSRETWLPRMPMPKPGEIFRAHNLHLRMVGQNVGASRGFWDEWIVARANDPIAELKVLVRKATLPLINFIFRLECAVLAFQLKPLDGRALRFTGWCAEHLL